MNVLAQVAALLRICFVGSCQAFECGAKLVQGLPVEAILICLYGQNRFLSSHNEGSRRTSRFLTDSNGRFSWGRLAAWLRGCSVSQLRGAVQIVTPSRTLTEICFT